MTDKSAAAVREFAEYMSGWILPNDPTVVGNIMIQLTALIEEHYVSREEHEKMKHNLTHCGSCGDPLSRDCPRCKHLWET